MPPSRRCDKTVCHRFQEQFKTQGWLGESRDGGTCPRFLALTSPAFSFVGSANSSLRSVALPLNLPTIFVTDLGDINSAFKLWTVLSLDAGNCVAPPRYTFLLLRFFLAHCFRRKRAPTTYHVAVIGQCCDSTSSISIVVSRRHAASSRRVIMLLYHAASSYLCLLYTSPSPRDKRQSRMPSSA